MAEKWVYKVGWGPDGKLIRRVRVSTGQDALPPIPKQKEKELVVTDLDRNLSIAHEKELNIVND